MVQIESPVLRTVRCNHLPAGYACVAEAGFWCCFGPIQEHFETDELTDPDTRFRVLVSDKPVRGAVRFVRDPAYHEAAVFAHADQLDESSEALWWWLEIEEEGS